MTLRTLGTSIPPSLHYPGLVTRKLSETREIVCYGWGPEVEREVERRAEEILSETQKEG